MEHFHEVIAPLRLWMYLNDWAHSAICVFLAKTKRFSFILSKLGSKEKLSAGLLLQRETRR